MYTFFPWFAIDVGPFEALAGQIAASLVVVSLVAAQLAVVALQVAQHMLSIPEQYVPLHIVAVACSFA